MRTQAIRKDYLLKALHNVVLMTFVPGLQGTDNRSCSIRLLMPVQVDIVLPRALPDCYPSATVRHASTRESPNKAGGNERLPHGKCN